jgi:curved DNA-binding protein CbpA
MPEAVRASLWSILGVEPRATVEEIKRAFRKRALETHPDRGGDAELFRSVQRAYEQALARRARPGRRRKR